jgi:hypothetical protein
MNGAAATRLSASAMASASGCEYMTALSPAVHAGPILDRAGRLFAQE